MLAQPKGAPVPPLQPAASKILYLESLRGIAALVVALLHLPFQLSVYPHATLLRNGWLMVDFFFVLSGFVIALNYQHKIRTFGNLVNFQSRRFLRLYPLHFLMLMVFLGIALIKYVGETRFGLSAAVPESSPANDLASFLQIFF